MIRIKNLLPKVTIIIPVYNLENYLQDCLNSAINQSLREIEIICINDGSTDCSLQILRRYEKNDERVTVIDRPNGGVASARNEGLNIARGEFIRFLDGDDLLPPDACENLYKNAEKNKSDILICGYDYISKEGGCKSLFIFPNASYDLKNIHDRRMVYSNYLILGTQNQFFRHKTIGDIRFQPLLNGEDYVFYFEVMRHSGIFTTLRKSCYVYRHREDSLSHQKKEFTLNNFIRARESLIILLENVENKIDVEDIINKSILSWAIRDFVEIEKVRSYSKSEFKNLIQHWSLCYREKIIKRHKRDYLGEFIARAIFLINSVFLYILISKIILLFLKIRNIFREILLSKTAK